MPATCLIANGCSRSDQILTSCFHWLPAKCLTLLKSPGKSTVKYLPALTGELTPIACLGPPPNGGLRSGHVLTWGDGAVGPLQLPTSRHLALEFRATWITQPTPSCVRSSARARQLWTRHGRICFVLYYFIVFLILFNNRVNRWNVGWSDWQRWIMCK